MTKIMAKTGGNFTPAPSGNHVAKCTQMVYMGIIPSEYQGEKTRREQIWLEFTLTNETNDKGDNHRIGKFYTLSLNEKSNLYKDLVSWRGQAFSPADKDGFDVAKVAGAPCMVNVVHVAKNGGGERAVISSITPLPKGMKIEGEFTANVFSIAEPEVAAWEFIPTGIQTLMQKSESFGEVEKMLTANPNPSNPAARESVPLKQGDGNPEWLGKDKAAPKQSPPAPEDDLPF